MCLTEMIKWKSEICWKAACLPEVVWCCGGKSMKHLQYGTEFCVSWVFAVFSQQQYPWNPTPVDTKGLLYSFWTVSVTKQSIF
jgi:hypothetical protein